MYGNRDSELTERECIGLLRQAWDARVTQSFCLNEEELREMLSQHPAEIILEAMNILRIQLRQEYPELLGTIKHFKDSSIDADGHREKPIKRNNVVVPLMQVEQDAVVEKFSEIIKNVQNGILKTRVFKVQKAREKWTEYAMQ
jgi:hypothetical protein